LLVDLKTSADRPQRDPSADSLQNWLAHVNRASSAPVACHPEPDGLGPQDRVYYYRPGEFVVRHDDHETLAAVVASLANLGATVVEQRAAVDLPVSQLRLAPGSPTVPELLERLQEGFPKLQGIVSPNYVAFQALVLNGAPWVNGGPTGAPASVSTPHDQPAIASQSAPAAKLLVLDTGLLAENAPTRPWMVKVSGPPEPPAPSDMDLFDCHGLFVAGVAAGAIPKGAVRVVDVFDDSGAVDDFQLGQVMAAELAASPDVRVLNFSGGIYAPPNAVPQTLKAAIQAKPGVLFVAAAGNLPAGGQSGPYYPAAFGTAGCPNVVGVGAADAQGTPAGFSNADPTSAHVWAHGAGVVNAFKPGTVHVPPLPDAVIAANPPRTAKWSGTSFAAPLVAGMMARYMATAGAMADRLTAVQWLAGKGWATTAGGTTVIKLPK
jgi:hypothetical protein